jgi:uncharacterized membrane protein
MEMKAIEVAMAGVGAALYAALGYLSFAIFPVFAPVVGIVRFWPVVFIPAVVAVLFGRWAGGISAAIGIFISDVLIHHDPLLSLTAGVTANFIGFYLLGWIARKNLNWKKTLIGLGIGCVILIATGYLFINPNLVVDYYARLGASITVSDVMQGINVVVGVFLFSYALVIAVGFLIPKWRSYCIASVIGLMVGSIIVGLGVWAYSQVFIMPASFNSAFQLPTYAALVLFVWTFATEIPFMLILGPPILEACYRAFPSLRPKKEGN